MSCLNCKTEIDGNFCPECGQPAATARLATGDVLAEVAAHLFQYDSKILRTVVGLTTSPGRVCAEYVEGRRVRYVAPLKYFLVTIALALLANLLTGFDPLELTGPAGPERAREVQRIVAQFGLRHLDLAVLLALPFFVAAIRLLFRRSGHTYAEVAAFTLFMLGHVLLLGLVLSPLRFYAPALAVQMKLLLQLCFFTWASVRFFGVSWTSSLVRNLVLLFVYLVLVAFSITALVLPRVLPLIRA